MGGKKIATVVRGGKAIEILTEGCAQQLAFFGKQVAFTKKTLCVKSAREIDGFILFYDGQKWGVMNKRGEMVMSCEFEDIDVVPNGFLAEKDSGWKKFYRQDGKPLVLNEKYRIIEYYPDCNCAIMEGVAPRREDNVYAFYSFNTMNYLVPWTNSIRNLGRIYFIENNDSGKVFVVCDDGFSLADKVEHLEEGVCVWKDNDCLLYDTDGDIVWRGKKRKP